MMSKQQRVLAALVIGLVVLLLAQLALAGEPQRVTRAPGLFELRLPSIPEGADVSWEAKQPLTLDFRQYERGAAFVAYATSGELVIVSDVIDWESKKRDKTTWIIKIEGTPPPPVPPDPTPPLPTGLAGEVYKLAKPIQQSEKCLKYAANYEVVSTEIAAGALRTLPEVRSRILSLNQPLQAEPRDIRWQSVGTAIQAAMAKATTVEDAKRVIDDAAKGLKLAGGAT